MRCSRLQYRRDVMALLEGSARFLSGLLHSVPHPSFSCSFSPPFFLLGRMMGCTQDECHQCFEETLCRGAAANCLLDSRLHSAEVRASMIGAFFAKQHWNNSVTHSMDAATLSSLEKNVTDAVATLLRLPSRFFWSVGAEREGKKNKPSDSTSSSSSSPHLQRLSHTSLIKSAQTAAVHAGRKDTLGGGGVLHSTSLESLIVVLTTARSQAHARYLSAHFSSPEDEARLTSRLVLYCSDQSQPLLRKAARCVGIQHIRVMKTVYSPHIHNYPMQLDMLKAAIAEDIAHGLYPLLVCGVFGSRTTGAVDPLEELGELCRRVKLWFHIDASHSGLALASASASASAHRRETGQPRVDSGCIEGVDSVAEKMWMERTLTFYNAALLADSIHVGISTSFLPTLSATSPASLLYVADVAKVIAAIKRTNVDDEAGGNAWCTPEVTGGSASLLRLEGPEMCSNEVMRLAFILMQCDPSSMSCVVQGHQASLRYFEERIRADGRFDCSIHASCFGMVLFRWLALADEETATLMQRWGDLLNSSSLGRGDGGNFYRLRVSLGLTRIQRRMYICVGVGDDGGECLRRSEMDALLDLLNKAAAEWNITTSVASG